MFILKLDKHANIIGGKQEHRQTLKQVPQNFMKAFKVDGVAMRSQLRTLNRKIRIASEKILN